ncbi:glycosyltransferase, MGT family [Mycobacterium basiliense]|uniref:Glycosyltransferase, MGT family n=1 Tax=Mycobacterium basiliense TaxID=2094119 RepID=A0A3S4BE30_9MYCO|nr:glycosyltransferase [Mycobacterium basiliense]VDM88626.1 glycosyltransferase, MGT family [Mycobacterium basiliense]
MKFALAINGTRGDVEPCAALGRELSRRGHEARIAVPPNLTGLVTSAGLEAVPYGPDTQELVDGEDSYQHDFWKPQHSIKLVREGMADLRQAWSEMATTLMSLADGVDLVLTGMIHQGIAANVAERYDIPLAAMHYLPSRVNGQVIPILPARMNHALISALWWVHWRVTKNPEEMQRRELGLPKATASSTSRILAGRALEIQAYDELCFPGLAAEWEKWADRRPFVGALTLELPTASDDEVLSWIAAGTPPIYFGFGSMPVDSPADTVAMISAACAALGERALICTGANDIDESETPDHVKLVPGVSHAAVFPACRAVVHHGGAGTTAAGMRAGIPTLILWIWIEQPIWLAQIKRLKVGAGRRLAATTKETLISDLRSILAPEYVTRAREVANRMTKPGESATRAADLLENEVSRNYPSRQLRK